MGLVVLMALGCGLTATHASAETNLTGKDAAHIDWGVKNCGVTSTDKEHAMVEQANELEGGVLVVRIAAVSVEDALHAVRGHLCFMPHLLGDDPWARRP